MRCDRPGCNRSCLIVKSRGDRFSDGLTSNDKGQRLRRFRRVTRSADTGVPRAAPDVSRSHAQLDEPYWIGTLITCERLQLS